MNYDGTVGGKALLYALLLCDYRDGRQSIKQIRKTLIECYGKEKAKELLKTFSKKSLKMLDKNK